MKLSSHLASQLYTNAQEAAKPTEPKTGNGDFSSFVGMAADFIDAMRNQEKTVQAGMVGRADPQAVVQALAATEVAVQTAVTMRDKVVEAYQEILRMPV